MAIHNGKNGRSERIRTSDPLLPKQVRYQAALRSDREGQIPLARGGMQGGKVVKLGNLRDDAEILCNPGATTTMASLGKVFPQRLRQCVDPA